MNTSVRPTAPGPLLALLLALCLAMPASGQEEDGFSEAELAQMLAPVALYPDALLSQILMAATYPLEVVEAARWSRQHPELEGSRAVDAVDDQDWDPSVKALVAFPRILAQMNEDLTWTRNLGDAFLAQEEDVTAVIQDLRRRADEAGHLDGQEHVRVVRDREVIIIEPANPRVVYVPYYQPTVVYGGWWWPGYAPVYWHPPYGYSTRIGITWVSGVPLSHGFFFGGFNWHHRHVVVVRVPDHHHKHGGKRGDRYPGRHDDRHAGRDPHRWRHDPGHRRGVAYRHSELRARYGDRTPTADRRHVHRPGRPPVMENQNHANRDNRPTWQERRAEQRGRLDQRERYTTRPAQPARPEGWSPPDRHARDQTPRHRDPVQRGRRMESSDTRGVVRTPAGTPGQALHERARHGQVTENTRRNVNQRVPRPDAGQAVRPGRDALQSRPQRPDTPRAQPPQVRQHPWGNRSGGAGNEARRGGSGQPQGSSAFRQGQSRGGDARSGDAVRSFQGQQRGNAIRPDVQRNQGWRSQNR